MLPGGYDVKKFRGNGVNSKGKYVTDPCRYCEVDFWSGLPNLGRNISGDFIALLSGGTIE